ncbi:hypothetical protein V8E53_011211 [Lactarius tabidus]
MSGTPSWKEHLTEGMKSFRKQDFDAQTHPFSQAIRLANDKSYVLYDCRAFIYKRLSCLNFALDNASMTIEIRPAHWQGYFHSARLLASLGRSEDALKMCSSALCRLGNSPKEIYCQQELSELCRHLEAQPKCYISGIPVELLVVVFKLSNNPSIIAHVCHHWREVAHSQPPLWHNLVLSAPQSQHFAKSLSGISSPVGGSWSSISLNHLAWLSSLQVSTCLDIRLSLPQCMLTL